MNGDTATAVAAGDGTPLYSQEVGAFVQVYGSLRKYQDALAAKFGEAARALAATPYVPDMKPAAATAAVTITGDTARVGTPQEELVSLKQINGQWKVQADAPDKVAQLVSRSMALAAVLDQSAADVLGGEVRRGQGGPAGRDRQPRAGRHGGPGRRPRCPPPARPRRSPAPRRPGRPPRPRSM